MASKRLSEETRIDENLAAGEFHCEECDALFLFADQTDDTRAPQFCPSCGRRNAEA